MWFPGAHWWFSSRKRSARNLFGNLLWRLPNKVGQVPLIKISDRLDITAVKRQRFNWLKSRNNYSIQNGINWGGNPIFQCRLPLRKSHQNDWKLKRTWPCLLRRRAARLFANNKSNRFILGQISWLLNFSSSIEQRLQWATTATANIKEFVEPLIVRCPTFATVSRNWSFGFYGRLRLVGYLERS